MWPRDGSKCHVGQTDNQKKRHQPQAIMGNDKNTIDQLKDLVELKDQLEDIQRRVEDEIQAGVPPGGSFLSSPFLKGFLAGYVVARLRSSPLLGVAVGTCTGMFAAQNYAIPNIETTVRDYISKLKGGSK
ncbi:SLC35A4 upstream open reading frame protein-like [Genypterus blacodes]|uniref:SLC35A4 upstream open reading frame protein-like n=1 Tax=Genypterus blacodes TaxID=154954 RepID=UPI003F769CD9